MKFMTFISRRFLVSILGCGLFSMPVAIPAAQEAAPSAPPAQQQAQPSSTPDQDQEPDPLKRQRSNKERVASQKALRQELKGTYKTWLNDEVPYIISDEERKAFTSLSNDEERDAFIESFWQRRNPNPDSPENEYREEHYRRIAYANEHFAAGKPGWKTDRGHIYIAFGPADDIDSHPSGGQYERPQDEGGGSTTTFPFEVWHYRYLEGIGENIDLEFVDTCQCGDYHFTIDRSEKDALLHVPGAGLTNYEQMNHKDKTDRFQGGIESLGAGPMGSANQGKEFDRIELAAKIFAPPPIKFKDLDAFVTEHKLIIGPVFPFDVRTDFIKVTDNIDMVPITIQIKNRDITFVTKEGVSKGEVNILGKVTTIMHKTVQTFEETVEIDQPSELLEKSLDRKSVYWKALPLQPGLYRLDIAIKDVNNPDHIGIYGKGISVPSFDDEKLGTSSLILADEMHTVSSRDIGAGNFIIGNTFVRPRVTANLATPVSFTRGQALNFWMQVYNLGIDEKSKQNDATIEYEITDLNTNKPVLDTKESSVKLSPNAEQLTLEKSMPLSSLQPGLYQVSIKVNDVVTKQQTTESAKFSVD